MIYINEKRISCLFSDMAGLAGADFVPESCDKNQISPIFGRQHDSLNANQYTSPIQHRDPDHSTTEYQ